MSNNIILVIENIITRNNPLVNHLRCDNYDVLRAQGANVIKFIMDRQPSIAMFDLTSSSTNSLALCAKLKEQYPFLPIIIVSNSMNDIDMDQALDAGVDDFIVYPFNPFELKTRIRAARSRASKEKKVLSKQSYAVPFVLERTRRGVYKDSQLIKLTEVEWQIMNVLMERVNEPISIDALIQNVWGAITGIDRGTVAVNILRLRKKIEADPSNPQYLITIRGLGYCFQADEIEKIS